MTEFDNVREALAQPILINRSEVHNITEDGVKRKANIDDLRVINKQVLFNLADLLGMSDLYCKIRTQKSQSANWLKSNYYNLIIAQTERAV